MEAVLDALCLTEKAAAHSYLKKKLKLPEYYGNNLDGLYDCLTEVDEMKITIKNKGIAGDYFEKIYPVFLMASEENPGLVLK